MEAADGTNPSFIGLVSSVGLLLGETQSPLKEGWHLGTPPPQCVLTALVPGRKEGRWLCGGGGGSRVIQCGAQGPFFTAGGRRDHIKFFITDLQKMRELYITLICLGFFFPSFSFYKTIAGKKDAEGR